jgi:CheY-like chemotaxis protein
MPVANGMQLLNLIHRKQPQLKKAVLSGYIDEGVRAEALAGGAELVLEKPRDGAGFEALFAALNALLHLQTEEGFRGTLRRVGLEDIIQMECLSRHSLILKSPRGTRGRLSAKARSSTRNSVMLGRAALQELLTRPAANFITAPSPLRRARRGRLVGIPPHGSDAQATKPLARFLRKNPARVFRRRERLPKRRPRNVPWLRQ